MKKTASRIIALIVALSMLLIPSAFAAERNAASLTVGNFEFIMGEETISLPVYLTLAGGADLEGERGYLQASLSTESATAFSGVVALENNEVKAYLNGMNYGFAIPLEQIASMLEEEMGMSIEEALTEAMADPQVQEALTALMNMTAQLESLENAEVDPEAMLNALNITLTEKGETAVTLFDVETTAAETEVVMAPTTLKAIFDAMGAAAPELNAFYAEYFKMMNEMLAAEGAEMTIEQALEMSSLAITAYVYEAAEGASAEILLSVSATDGEETVTIDMPIYFVTLTDEEGVYTEIMLDMPVDGEGMYLDIYTDNYTDETGTYQNLSYTISVYDAEDETIEMEMGLDLYAMNTEAGLTVGLDATVTEDDETVSFGAAHTCYEVVETEESDSYNGYLYGYGVVEETPVEFYMDTNLTLTSVPEGELLTLPESINPLEADEAAMEKFAADAQPALISGLGVLMQDPALASMLSGIMSGMMG